jgi:HD-GYP domain-containing protein (c-di-GMP phosphodiesterase class II)
MAHPVIGYRILKNAGFPANACVAVLEHNERIDGSGLPRKLRGDQISDFGRILAVATSYNAATSTRPYKAGIDGHSGVMDLLKDAGKRYDEKALAALLFTLSLYPIGTYVRMTDSSVGIVVRANERDPKYPQVKLIIDEKGNRYSEQPIVQTREGDEVTIESSLSRDELIAITTGK